MGPTSERPLRILLLIIQFPPDINATGRLMARVCAGLRQLGHQVSVVAAFPHYERFRVWDNCRGKLAERSSHEGMDVLRLWVYASGAKQRMLDRLLSYLSFNALATLVGLFSRQTYDVILAPNGSFFTGLAAYVGWHFKRVPFVYNVQDLYPETPVAAGQLRNRRAIAALERMEQFMYRAAAHVTVITPSFRENLVAKGVPAEKISVISNFVDTDFIRPLPKVNGFSQRHGLADRFVVTHAGNLGYVYDLETLLEAAALLRDESEILFLIVGDGVARPALEQKSAALGLANVRFLPFQPEEDLPWLRAASDVQISLYKPGSGRFSMPSKIYEIMASGRPLLVSADADSDVWRLLAETGCGLCVPPEDPRGLAEAVLALYRDPNGRARMGALGREQAERHYSPDVVARQYDEVLRRVGMCATSLDRRRPA